MPKEVDLVRSDRRLHSLKKRVITFRKNMQNHIVYRDQLLSLLTRLSNELGDESYIKAMLNSGDQRDVNKYTNVINKLTTLRDWIFNNFPKQGEVWLVYGYDINGIEIRIPLTNPQKNAIKTIIDEVAAL